MQAAPLLICSWLLGLLAVSTAVAQELPPDLIALSGHQVPQLLGVPPVEITATVWRAGAPVAVHVQVDQRRRDADSRWQYAFEAGEEPHPAATPGLSADDLLLLASDEGGERTPAPPGTVEIEVVGSDSSRWFYLGRGRSPALPPLLVYDAGADRLRGLDYALGFSHSGSPVIDTLVLGDPEHSANIIDRSKARLDVELALGIGRIARSEDDVRVRTTGLHSGSLRIIRECEVRGRMLLGFYSPPVRDTFIFYPHAFLLPTTVRLTPTARMLTRDVTLRISMDLVDAGTLTFQSEPEIPAPIAIDGHGGARGGTQPIRWYLLRRGDSGLLGWLEARDDIARDVTLYYRDDRLHADPPDGQRGEIGDHGFLFRHTGPLPAGDVRLSSYGWVLHGKQLERPAAELRAFATGPTVRVH
jgi:hypothetical protein